MRSCSGLVVDDCDSEEEEVGGSFSGEDDNDDAAALSGSFFMGGGRVTIVGEASVDASGVSSLVDGGGSWTVVPSDISNRFCSWAALRVALSPVWSVSSAMVY